MKRFIFIPALLVLMASLGMSPGWASTQSQDEGQTAFTIYTKSGLEHLAMAWKIAWTEKHPDIPININLLSSGDLDELTSDGHSAILLREENVSLLPKAPGWKMVIGRDVVTPIMNAQNPHLQSIQGQGIATDVLARFIEESGYIDWDALLGTDQGTSGKIYMTDDATIRMAAARFLNLDSDNTNVTFVDTEQALQEAVASDPYAIGFGRLPMTEEAFGSGKILLLPIDRNGNGKLEYHEQIYGSLHEFMRGVWIGKYPHALVSSIYLAAPVMPADELCLAFLKWTVTDGQPFVAQEGFGELLGSERNSRIDELTGEPLLETAHTERWATVKIVLFIILGLAASVFLISTFFKSRKEARQTKHEGDKYPAVINEENMDIPAGLYYDKTHTWAYMNRCGHVKVGIDDFLQHVIGPITRVQMKDSGEKVKRGESLFTLVQDGKQLTIHAPISGTIKAINNDLIEEPDLVNQSPYDDGWIYLFEPINWQRELQFMRMAVAYKDWLKNEFMRLRDFLAAKVNRNAFAYAGVALQDGGELTDHVMKKLDPEVWEEFQKHFVDTSY